MGSTLYRYLRPARADELVARAEVIHTGQTLVTVRCEIFDRGADGNGSARWRRAPSPGAEHTRPGRRS